MSGAWEVGRPLIRLGDKDNYRVFKMDGLNFKRVSSVTSFLVPDIFPPSFLWWKFFFPKSQRVSSIIDLAHFSNFLPNNAFEKVKKNLPNPNINITKTKGTVSL